MRQRLRIDYAAQRARCEDVGWNCVDCVGARSVRTEFACELFRSIAANVRNRQACAGFVQQPAQARADVTESLNRDMHTDEIITTETRLHDGAQAVEYTLRSMDRRIAGSCALCSGDKR